MSTKLGHVKVIKDLRDGTCWLRGSRQVEAAHGKEEARKIKHTWLDFGEASRVPLFCVDTGDPHCSVNVN